jgi:hypothetical protein
MSSTSESTGHGEKRSRRAEVAIAALLTEPTVEQAAAKAGVSHRTLKGWLRQPRFLAAFRRAQREILDRTVAQLVAVSGEAVQTLRRNLACGKPAAEIRAAGAILERMDRGLQTANLAAEVEDLRRQLSEARHGNHRHLDARNGTAQGGNGQQAATAGLPSTGNVFADIEREAERRRSVAGSGVAEGGLPTDHPRQPLD